MSGPRSGTSGAPPAALPYPYCSGDELLALGTKSGLSIADMMLANEVALRVDPMR